MRRLILLFAVAGFSCSASLRAQQFRAAWADIFHVGMGSTSEVDTMVNTLVSGHYNVVIVQVLGYMDSSSSSSHGAFWKSSLVPWSTKVTTGFDPLAYLCTKAHANGIEVHAWLGGSSAAMYRVTPSTSPYPPAGNTTLINHPEWFIVPYTDSEANAVTPIDGVYALDMGSPDVQEYIVSIVKELVTNYPIDGINWDDELNGTGYNAGFGYPAYDQATYAKSGLARYRINTGVTGTPVNTDTAWSNYRRRYKNELMARCQAEIQSIKTNPRQPLRHTSAALAYSPVPTTCTFSGSAPYTYFCDWAGMLQNGWLDAVIPQTYSASTFNAWADKCASCWQYNRQIFPGLGAYMTNFATISSQLQYAMITKGLKGAATYSYGVAAVTNSAGWWSFIATNYYTNVVTTPTMPWRNTNTATEGIMWGRVTAASTGLPIDDATVVVTGGSTVKTDGNGYYVATLVPAVAAGTVHAVGATKSGIGGQTNATAKALAGDVARYDLVLGVAPAITIQPVSKTNNAGTTATFSVSASGTIPAYQWRKNGVALSNSGNTSGALAATLTLSNVTNTDAASYSVAITNIYGAVTSLSPALVVIIPPSITASPFNLAVAAGDSAAFSVTAAGTAPLSYQWRLNSVAIGNATNSSYTRTNAQTATAGTYNVVVTNAAGSATSGSAVLTVNNPPSLTAVPNLTVHAGAKVIVTNVVSDPDLPAQTFTFSLNPGSPGAATIGSTSGVLAWSTATSDLNTTNPVSVRVTDSGTPALSATNIFTVTVIGQPLILTTALTNSIFSFTWSAIAGDTYRVQYKSNLLDNTWADLISIKASNTTATCSDTISTNGPVDQRYYRLLLVQ